MLNFVIIFLARASASLDELRSTLTENPRRKNASSMSLNYKTVSLEDSSHVDNDYIYKSATEQLSKMIAHQDHLLRSSESQNNVNGGSTVSKSKNQWRHLA